MPKYPRLEEMSGTELDQYMDDLIQRGEPDKDSPEWRRAHTFWEKNT